MKVLKLLIVCLMFSLPALAQTTPWSSTPAVTPQTRTLSGSPQIRWLWNTGHVYSVADSLAKFKHYADSVISALGTIYIADGTILGDRFVNTTSYRELFFGDIDNATSFIDILPNPIGGIVQLRASDSVASSTGNIKLAPTFVQIQSIDNSSSNNGNIDVNNNSVAISALNGATGDHMDFVMAADTNRTYFNDTRSRGINYSFNDDANMLPQGLMPKRYIDSSITAHAGISDTTALARKSGNAAMQQNSYQTHGTTGNGFIALSNQSVSPSKVSGLLKMYRDSVGSLGYINGLYRRTFKIKRASDQTINFPYRSNPTLADSTDVVNLLVTKPDTAVTNALNIFNNANKINYYEILKARASHIHNMAIKPYASPNIFVDYNFDDGFTTEYQFTKNVDGVFIINGVRGGKTVAASVPQVSLNGTFNTASVNSYTTSQAAYFNFTFNGNGFSFNTYMDNRGGRWYFSIPALGIGKFISTYAASASTNNLITVFANLPENNYTVIATFKGDDPLNPPSGGAGTSRGWLEYSAATPQTIQYSSLTGVIDPVNRTIIVPTGTIDELAVHFHPVASPTAPNQWVLYHGVANATRNVQARFEIDQRIATLPDSITTLTNGIKKINFIQTYDAYYPTLGTTKYWGGKITHTFDESGLTLGNDITFTSDSVRADSSYMTMLSGNMNIINSLTMGDSTYAITPGTPGVTYTTNILKPSNDFKYTGTWAGNNYEIAAHVNLAASIDYPRNPYKYGSVFFTTRASTGIAKTYYNLSPPGSQRTFKTGQRLQIKNNIYIARVPAITDTAKIANVTQILAPNGGGTGSNATPTDGQILIAKGGISIPRTVSGDATVDTAGVVTLAPTGVAANTYGRVAVNTKGLITAATVINTVPTGGTGVATITGIIKGNGASAFTAAVSNTDYLPVANPTSTGIFTFGSATGIIRSTSIHQSPIGTISTDSIAVKIGTTGRLGAISATALLYNSAVTSSSAGTLTLTYGKDYIFTGTTTTWTLPALSATNSTRSDIITIKNAGSGNITLNSNTGSTIYDGSLVGTITISPGAAITLVQNNTAFYKE